MNENSTMSSKRNTGSFQYDQSAKEILADKMVLAWILKYSVEELKDWDPKEIAAGIEGQPEPDQTLLNPGETNVKDPKTARTILGRSQEDAQKNEGKIYYDLLFYLNLPIKQGRFIINIEAQKNNIGRKIIKRSIFYLCRLVSSQKNRDFLEDHYEDLLPVCSIWICMYQAEPTLDILRMDRKQILGSRKMDKEYDLIRTVMIGLGSEMPPKEDTRYTLHRLLYTLFSGKVDRETRLTVSRDEYGVELNEWYVERVNTMCNLGEGLFEQGREQGLQQGLQEGLQEGLQQGLELGREQGLEKGRVQEAERRKERDREIVRRMNSKGFTLEIMADIADLSVEEVERILKKDKKPA